MRSDYLIALLLFIPLTALQLTVIQFISFNQIAPDLILILLVYYTLKLGQIPGTILGFIFGLMLDLITANLGSHMFALTLSGFLAGYFFNENKVDYNIHSFMFLFIVLLIGSINALVFSFFSSTNVSANFLTMFFVQGLLPGVYSTLAALPLVVFFPRKIFT